MGRSKNQRNPVNVLFGWVRRQSVKVKSFLGVTAALFSLFFLWLLVRDHDHLFVAAEMVHAIGIVVLIYKLTRQKTCSGLSLRSQELTAIFLSARLFCSVFLEHDIHTVLDTATLIATLWVVYMIRYKLNTTYNRELDNLPIHYMVAACALLALFIKPYTIHYVLDRFLWAFCVYLESVSVLPQLHMMQKAKMVEPFTAHYVFALGVARFFGCAHWIFQVIATGGRYIFLIGSGYFWPPMVLLAEVVQTFILADFCYYYVKSVMDGQLLVRLSSMV
ncbi:hypothetical protein AMTRI_Chr06g194950 [Amborella trichopoda]